MKAISYPVLAILCVLVLLVIGCQPSPPSPATSGPSPTGTQLQPKSGGTLRYWINVAPAGWDTHRKVFYSPYFTYPMFNNLVRFDNTKTGLGPENLGPDLAEKWDVSKDGLTYTFYLRKNVKWHDGKPFTADDVVYSIEKMVDPKRSAPALNLPNFDNVQKVDDYTVKINFKKPQPSLLAQLAYGYTYIQAKHLANVDYKSTDFLVGTGPFKYKSYTSGVALEVVRNPDYFVKDAQGKQLPYLDGISITVIGDRNAQADAFITQKLDMTNPSYGCVSIEQYERHAKDAPTAIGSWVSYPNGSPLWLNFNYAPLKDIRVRRAVTLATDMKLAVLAGFGDNRFRDEKYSVFAQGWNITTEEKNKILGWDKPYDQRVTEAQKLMADAGFASGFKFEITVQNLPENVRHATTVADQLRRGLKIDATVRPLEPADVVQTAQQGNFNAYLGPLVSMVGEPDEVMPYFVTGNTSNVSRYSNPKMDALFQQQSQEPDPVKRKAIVQDIERLILTDIVCIPDGLSGMGLFRWPQVQGFVPSGSPYGGHLQMEKVWLNK